MVTVIVSSLFADYVSEVVQTTAGRWRGGDSRRRRKGVGGYLDVDVGLDSTELVEGLEFLLCEAVFAQTYGLREQLYGLLDANGILRGAPMESSVGLGGGTAPSDLDAVDDLVHACDLLAEILLHVIQIVRELLQLRRRVCELGLNAHAAPPAFEFVH